MKKTDNQSFFESVWEVTRAIPYGRVTSYGAIAKALGTGLSARMVGWALNKSIWSNADVPAHRVVNRNGLLTGKMHFKDAFEMENALRSEGIEVENDQVVDFEKLFWNPQELIDF